jgi:hypothetical protein
MTRSERESIEKKYAFDVTSNPSKKTFVVFSFLSEFSFFPLFKFHLLGKADRNGEFCEVMFIRVEIFILAHAHRRISDMGARHALFRKAI